MKEESDGDEESEDDPTAGAKLGYAATDFFLVQADDAIHVVEEERFLVEKIRREGS